MTQTELAVKSPAFEEGGMIPVKHTGYGDDISPALELGKIAEGAKSIVIIMDDVDHPIKNYNHWVLWNLPVMVNIPEDMPHGERPGLYADAVQGRGYGKHRYRGPKPPFNWLHRYRYSVYVLDTALDISPNSRKKDLLVAMEGHILQEGSIVGKYQRRPAKNND